MVDGQDRGDLKVTAIRETFEESGLLIIKNREGIVNDPDKLHQAREDIHSQKLHFVPFLEKNHLKLDLDGLLPFTQWITPKVCVSL
jgi:hypothetical protein